MNRRNFIVSAIATGTVLFVGLKKVVAHNLAQERSLNIAPEEVSVIKRGMPEASDADLKPPEWTKQYELVRTGPMYPEYYYVEGLEKESQRWRRAMEEIDLGLLLKKS